MRIMCYSYEADLHCISCTVARFGGVLPCALGADENGVPYDVTDNEGNAIHPVFETDEGTPWLTVCGACSGEL
jgi:hypothetical protein